MTDTTGADAERWVAVRVRPAGDREAVTAAIFEAGSQGVQDEGPTLLTHFPPGTDVAVVRAAILAADAGATVETSPVADVDWTEAWKERVRAHELAGLTVAPPWLADRYEPSRTIVIDPGMAFGTGEHATTRGVVRLMQHVIEPGQTVADLGAGSAVLAIAAAKLGASRVWAVEMDEEAIANAEENVVRNGVADRVRVIHGDAGVLLPLIAPVDVVLANIISSVLVQLLPSIAAALAPGGRAILSGVLQEERDALVAVLDATEWRVLQEDREDIWWSASIARR
ncbi:MAG TPA: 50S ribosomal protein L11 methyltransferase [Gemmatimonadaceae bacterium]|nr:50S ribosomal protein L11 methyltransferase [Gemmatimonadaceae bacterium]